MYFSPMLELYLQTHRQHSSGTVLWYPLEALESLLCHPFDQTLQDARDQRWGYVPDL